MDEIGDRSWCFLSLWGEWDIVCQLSLLENPKAGLVPFAPLEAIALL